MDDDVSLVTPDIPQTKRSCGGVVTSPSARAMLIIYLNICFCWYYLAFLNLHTSQWQSRQVEACLGKAREWVFRLFQLLGVLFFVHYSLYLFSKCPWPAFGVSFLCNDAFDYVGFNVHWTTYPGSKNMSLHMFAPWPRTKVSFLSTPAFVRCATMPRPTPTI